MYNHTLKEILADKKHLDQKQCDLVSELFENNYDDRYKPKFKIGTVKPSVLIREFKPVLLKELTVPECPTGTICVFCGGIKEMTNTLSLCSHESTHTFLKESKKVTIHHDICYPCRIQLLQSKISINDIPKYCPVCVYNENKNKISG